MAEYTRSDIVQWILSAFKVDSSKGAELQFMCPVCGHESCYFNVAKQVGYCHRATCRMTFTIDTLIDIVGYPPTLAGYVPAAEVKKAPPVAPVALPRTAALITPNDNDAITALRTRGVTWDLINKFKIHQDDKRFYVPVYEGGRLVQYNSRRINKDNPPEEWFKAGPKPYKYASGHPITHYFLGWDECKLWNDLVLVENTFVSMWLRHLHATATFGSHLSDVHIDKITHSRIKKVTFLWDSGTGAASEKASKKLRWKGIDTKIISIPGQPDDHTLEEIKEMINERI